MLNEVELYSKLCALAGPPLVEASPQISGAASERMRELDSLLSVRNGFYAFESALHVRPSGQLDNPMTAEHWNEVGIWKADYQGLADDLWCFAEDVFGVQFAISGEVVVQFDPETGDRTTVANCVADWVDYVLGDYARVTGHPFARAWQVQNGALAWGQRLLPVTPFVLGGLYEVSNFFAGDDVEGMRSRGNLAVQIRDLPDGSPIEYIVRR